MHEAGINKPIWNVQGRTSWVSSRYLNVWSRWSASKRKRHTQIDERSGEKRKKVQKASNLCASPASTKSFLLPRHDFYCSGFSDNKLNFLLAAMILKIPQCLLALHAARLGMIHFERKFLRFLRKTSAALKSDSSLHHGKCELCAAQHCFSIKIK